MPKKSDFGRKSLIRAIHVRKSTLRLEDEAYRDVLIRETGQNTCSALDLPRLKTVLAALNAYLPPCEAIRPLPGDYSPKYPRESQEAKLVALWITAAKAKLIRDGGHSALVEYVWRGHAQPKTLLPTADLLKAAPSALKSARIQGLYSLLERGGIDPKSPKADG